MLAEPGIRTVTLSRLERRLRALEAQIGNLGAWRDARWVVIQGWHFSAPGGIQATLQEGDRWPVSGPALTDRPVRLRAELTVPADFALQPLTLTLEVGGEALLTAHLDGVQVYCGGVNPYHRVFPLHGRCAGGERLSIEVLAVPRGLFGSPVARPHLERARLSVPQPEIGRLHADLTGTAAAIRVLGREALAGAEPGGDSEVAERLLNLVDEVLARLDWPSGEAGYLSRLHELGGGETFTQGLWSLPEPLPQPEPLTPEVLERVMAAGNALRAGLAALAALFPPRGRLALSGHAHLDLGWLWPVHETRRKGRRTLHTVLELMERFPDFTFNQSSAQLYAWMQEDDPALFEGIRRRVHEGRFEPVGGMWVEPDCQMSGGEALARHLLYGQAYFRREFGRVCTVAWLPDTFGFTPALPQLLLQAGIPGFFTTKLNWNEETRFPHDLFHWEGLDGSRVLAHSFDNPSGRRAGLGNYNGDVHPHDLVTAWQNFGGKSAAAWGQGQASSLFTFGYGDGGGGPSAEMLSAYDLLRHFPALPTLEMTRVDDFFAALPQSGLPVWSGELYLELHRGTLTSQARIKRLNRQAEHRLLEAEALNALSGTAAQAEVELLWKTVLLNQFHDILPGSSIREVYSTAEPELEGVVAQAAELVASGQQAQDGVWTVFNPATWNRPLTVLLPGLEEQQSVQTEDGASLSVQRVEGGLLVHAPELEVPALGQLRLRVQPGGTGGATASGGGVRAWVEAGGAVLEHPGLRAEIGADGRLTRLYDHAAVREALGADGLQLVVYPDLPYAWEAWDVAHGLDAAGEVSLGQPLGGECTVEVTQTGPLQASVRVRHLWRGSEVMQTFVLRAGQQRLEVQFEADWHERRTLLRAECQVNARSHEVWAETAMGAQARPSHRNTPADRARFEVSTHRWLDLSEPGYGLSLLNDGRYGHSALGDTLAISLLRGPMWPDPLADLGRHSVTYALYPHAGDWRQAHTPRQGFDLNSPLLAVSGMRAEGPAFHLTGLPVMPSALKLAEAGDGALILRVYEGHGERGEATLTLAGLERAWVVNLLEEEQGEMEVTNDALTLAVTPYQVLSLRLERRRLSE
ncbi:alpha-mannosidase [Deinococcus sp.]|uniref:alpha-mannosidase n=1 Tax=Deinococcus sp. TaxID=47478 RepID=UPI003C7C919A